ncbi:hypothetical protein EsDP_00004532 [Epichloe bromicola]|uniref:C3H1-type domain-containing protein n=1 Tax=Epichloe bromicola TaxID=79588 RepID=A0ABQ0CS11_9HYPO
MNQPGHGFALPDGHGLRQDFANTAQSPNKTAIYHSNGYSQGSLGEQKNVAPNYGHSMIPGLGLGASNNPASSYGSGLNDNAPSWRPQPQNSTFGSQTGPVLQTRHASVKIPGLNRARDIVSEDGQVCEDGEVEVVYEPVESHQQAVSVGQGQQPNSEKLLNAATVAQQLNSERDGSYSPYLSPQELLPSGKDLPVSQTGAHISTLDARNQQSPKQTQHKEHRAFQQSSISLTDPDQSSHSHLQDSRKKAKDAILRLWPLDIRFHNYLAEGLDEAILKSLFQDLGLSIDESTRTTQVDNTKSSVAEAEKTKIQAKEAEDKKSKESTSTAVDRSEERKDRIARLLAAKGSKQSVSTVVASQNPVLSAVNQTQTQATKSAKSSMSQVEKSKLIQQKIAALKKARETPQEQKPMQLESSDSGQNESTSEAVKEIHGVRPAESTPGPSPFPVKKTWQLNGAVVKPVADLQTASSQHAYSSAPFDQNPESRPFLINVSDDEGNEDEEMEIDSPARPETPPNMLRTPIHHDASLHDPFSLSDPATARQIRSPASISIPLRNISRNNGGDLQSMNKQIEEMKRKIAEAEARKKAKTSRQGSPTLSQRHDSSLDDNSDVASRPIASVKPFYGDLALGPKPSLSPILKRRSRSRAASERLPLLEARRREQLEKLKTLQSEVAKIEMELEKDQLEEEQLKGEIMTSDSGKGDALFPVVEAALTAEVAQASYISDKMDMVEESSPVVTDEGFEVALTQDKPQTEKRGGSSPVDALVPNDTEVIGNCERDGAVANVSTGKSTTTNSSENATSDGLTSSKPDVSQYDGTSAKQVNDDDVAMEDTGYSADEDVEEDSEDDYEPPEVTQSSLAANDEPTLQDKPSPAENDAAPAVEQVVSRISLKSASDPDPPRSSVDSEPAFARVPPATSFLTYETPLQYFHAYRFHPFFNKTVAGGLRSLTYSNKIDVKKELCPDELGAQRCSRGSECDYQHFETMQAPDDQILLQLGAAEHYDEEQRENYISGLKQLLTDYRTRKVKDFNTISQGIVDYRARFLGDRTKILPLGHVSL